MNTLFRFRTFVLSALAVCTVPAFAQLTLIQEGGSFIEGNLAPAGTAFAKDVLDGYSSHTIPHLNDAVYGNANSWIGSSANSFAGIALGETPVALNRIAFGRDNLGNLPDRCEDLYTIQFTTEPNPTAATTAWTDIGTVDLRAGGLDVGSPARRHVFSFPPVNATGVRIVTLTDGTCIDEIELANQQPSAPTDIEREFGRDTIGDGKFIAEQNDAGAVVAMLRATNPNAADTHTFELAGGVDEASFAIEGNLLKLVGVADFAAKKSYAIRIRALNSANSSLLFEKDFTFYVTGRELSVRYDDVEVAKSDTAPVEVGAEFVGDTHTFVVKNNGILPVRMTVDTSNANLYSITVVGGTGGGGTGGTGSGSGSSTGSTGSTGSGSTGGTGSTGSGSGTTAPGANLLPGETAFVTLQVIGFFPGETVGVFIYSDYDGHSDDFGFRTQNGRVVSGDTIATTTGATVLYPLANDENPNTRIERVDGAGVTISADGRRVIVPAAYAGASPFHYTTSDGRVGSITLAAGTPVATPKKWAGLLYDADGKVVGKFNATVATGGKYTASIKVGHVRKTARFVAGTPVTTAFGALNVTLDLDNRLQVALGTGTTGDIRPLVPATKSAKYNVAMSAINSNLPGGAYANLSVKTSGAVSIAATLPDGMRFTAGGALADNGNVSIYAPVATTNPKATIAGEFAFADNDYTDVSGELGWVKPAQIKTTGMHASGADTILTMNGGLITPAVAPDGGLELNFLGGNFPAPFAVTSSMTLGKTTPVAPLKSLIVNGKTGAVSGSVIFSATKKIVPFRGVFLQRTGRIWTFIKGDTIGGRVEGSVD